ncbi:hypothetical protein R3P38DRAFT_2778481 [Favolaschia claudopus]|uniref:Uncharacterized protein n=1 Tax=Favolaschia claudopus TaxID=2862362 RepID=A0AAW0BGZ0_9AGAR
MITFRVTTAKLFLAHFWYFSTWFRRVLSNSDASNCRFQIPQCQNADDRKVRRTGLARKEHHRGGELEHVRGQNQTRKSVPSKKRKRTADTSRATLPIPARQNPWMLPAETAAIAATTQQADEYDQYFDDDHFTPDAEEEIARVEREALGAIFKSYYWFVGVRILSPTL